MADLLQTTDKTTGDTRARQFRIVDRQDKTATLTATSNSNQLQADADISYLNFSNPVYFTSYMKSVQSGKQLVKKVPGMGSFRYIVGGVHIEEHLNESATIEHNPSDGITGGHCYINTYSLEINTA